MFRCVNKKINLNEDFFKKNVIKYKQGNKKTFWGFASISSELNLKYYSNGKKKDIKEGTIFDLCGNIWGYDISLFNKMLDEQIILEPEQESDIMNVVPPSKNDFIHVRCFIKKTPIILKDIKPDYIKITYKFDGKKRDIRIFGESFVEKNSNLIFIYENSKYRIKSSLSASELKNNTFHIYLSGFNNITNLSHMFSCCEEVNYISLNNFLRYYNITDISYMFYSCYSLKLLPDDISNLDISNATNISNIFSYCTSLQTIVDISNWNTSNVTDISKIFYKSSNLSHLPDISKWNTSRVKDISNLFYNCQSLQYLSDISKWNTSNVIDMRGIFYECSSLSYLPDISKWNTSSAKNISDLFYNCKSLLYLPDISKWKTSNITEIQRLFYGCSSISKLPDISKWKLPYIINMEGLFYGCSSISILPDISKWKLPGNTKIDYILEECSSLSKIPDISNWRSRYDYFELNGCISLLNPDNSEYKSKFKFYSFW